LTVETLTLVPPAFSHVPDYHHSLGDEVVDLAATAGMIADPEQRLILDLIFARDRFGRSQCFEVVVIAPRQNLKTGAFKMAALGWLFITQEDLVIWSAHEFQTSSEDRRKLGSLAEETPWLDSRVKQIYEGNNYQAIELKTGQRLIFRARTLTGGRGLSGNKTVLDEGFALQPAHMGTLMPTLSAMPDPQLVYGSSACHANSVVLRKLRDRGRAGRSARIGFLEWAAMIGDCADERCEHEFGTVEGCEYDNRERWAEANSLLGRRRANGTGLTEEFIQAERESMTAHEFGRERLGVHDEPEGTEAAFGKGKWESCAGSDRPEDLRLGGLAIASSWDLSWSAIGAAGHMDGLMHIKPLAHKPGDDWVVEDAKALQAEHGVKVVIDEKGPAASLIPDLREADVDLHVADLSDACDAFDGLWKGVRGRGVRHGNYPELNTAAAAAIPRNVGDRRTWGRKQSDSDISCMEGVTLAAWWAANHQESDEPLVAWV
jgi:hypothetical protein